MITFFGLFFGICYQPLQCDSIDYGDDCSNDDCGDDCANDFVDGCANDCGDDFGDVCDNYWSL